MRRAGVVDLRERRRRRSRPRRLCFLTRAGIISTYCCGLSAELGRGPKLTRSTAIACMLSCRHHERHDPPSSRTAVENTTLWLQELAQVH